MNNNNISSVAYDYVFIGLGCGNSLLLLALHRAKRLENKRILIIEPSLKQSNDRTFCFWMEPQDLLEHGLEALVAHEWSRVIVGQAMEQGMGGKKYYHIPGISLYNEASRLVSLYPVERIFEPYNLEAEEKQGLCCITLGERKVYAHNVFDNRPPRYHLPRGSESELVQSFFGWEIETNEDVWDKEVFTMMDFEVPQNGSTQFMYVLPFSKTRALFEITRFGNHKLEKNEAESLLSSYLDALNLKYTVVSQEEGVIPMNSSKRITGASVSNWFSTGERGGQLKPSTGYSFVRSLRHADQLVKQISEHGATKVKVNNRFVYYDRLLLAILRDKPNRGKDIFVQLFAKNSATRVMDFLDEKTTFKEDLRILKSLPLGLFLGTAFNDLCGRFLNALKAIPIFLWFAILAFVLNTFQWIEVQLSLIIIGYLVLGIPHGALDHLHAIKDFNFGRFAIYILAYFGLGALIYALFAWNPWLGLTLFIGFSALHFGETDFYCWSLSNRWLALGWGTYALLGLLFSHGMEVQGILKQMGIDAEGILHSAPTIGFLWLVLGGLIFLSIYRTRTILLSVLGLMLLQEVPLVIAFSVYFIGQHSVNGWKMIRNAVDKKDVSLWLHALPFTLGAILLCYACLHFFGFTWGQIFIFLAALSFPHVLLMFRLNNTNSQSRSAL